MAVQLRKHPMRMSFRLRRLGGLPLEGVQRTGDAREGPFRAREVQG